MRGTIHYLNSERGFAFVEPADGSPDVFLHCTALHGSGIEFSEHLLGRAVEFDVDKVSPKGPRAVRVRVLP